MNAPNLLILGLGSNIGQRDEMIAQAVAALAASDVLRLVDVRVSSLVETPALLPENAPPEWNVSFLNAVACAACVADPMVILSEIKQIEQALGRQDRGRWGPREIDIDILAYGDRVLHTDALVIPHAGMLERDFVMRPLVEICPDWIYPDVSKRDFYGLTAEQIVQRHPPSI